MTRSALRAALYAVGGLLAAGAVALALLGCRPAAAGLAGWALVLIVGLLIAAGRAQSGPGLDRHR